MYRIHKIISWVCSIILFALSDFFALDVSCIYDEVLAFAGITFGFYVAAISTLCCEKTFLTRLHQNRVEVAGILTTHLHILKEYFSRALYSSLLLALFSILCQFVNSQMLGGILIVLLFNQFFFSFLLLKVLLKGFEIEVSSSKVASNSEDR